MGEDRYVDTALMQIQRAVVVPKEQWNDFSKFHYRNVESICRVAKEKMAELQIPGYISFTDRVELVGDLHYLVATVILDAGGSSISAEGWARIPVQKKGMDDCQILGSASSYARKYAISGLLAIDDSKSDPDSMDNREKPKKQSTNVLAPDVAVGLVNHLVGLVDSCETVKGIEDLYRDNREQIERLPEGQKADLISFFGERKSALKA